MKLHLTLCIGFTLIAIYSAQKKSECQEHREKAEKSASPVKVVPNCEANGEYAALQCHTEGKFCSCWRKDGTPITQPSTKIKSCQCLREKDEKLKTSERSISAFIPQCQEDGKFKEKQCWGSTGTCWCVNPETGKNITGEGKDC